MALAADEAASDVHVLKTDTFKPFLEENNLVLAEFYAPWCGHCKALAPEYETAATTLKEKGIKLAKIDCTEEQAVCEEQGVQGYPTLKVFRGPENPSPYTGQRKADAIVSYMTKQSLPPVSVLDKETIEAFKTSDKVVVIAYFNSDDKASNETFTALANTHRDSYLFGAISDASVVEAAGVKAPGVIVYRSFDEPQVIYDGKFEADGITSFVKSAATPLVGEVGPETYSGYMEAGIPLAYLFVDSDAQKKELGALLKPLAEKYKGKINFATIDAVAFGAHAGNLNLEQKWPAFAIQETVKGSKYPFSQDTEITAEALAKFVEEFDSGKVAPSIKSEAVPEKQEGPVHVIVAKNWEDLVINSEQDVLVEFYAPWCGHCKNLAPKYEELGGLYFNNPDYASKVIVAKVDATANDVPVDIQGFPTIKLYPAGKKSEPVDYNGSRTVEDLANFIRDNGSNKVDAYITPVEEAEEDLEEELEEKPLAEAAKAATSVVSEAAEKATDAAKSAVADDEEHDEL